jgi:hypothetical protein
VWRLEFANPVYLNAIDKDLSEILHASEADLMNIAYKKETIERFNTIASARHG